VSPQRVIIPHYVIDQLPKVDGLVLPTMINNLIGDIEKTHRNT
jgi:hypothetical protein